jgi:outer membrane protein with beta-barrel domain
MQRHSVLVLALLVPCAFLLAGMIVSGIAYADVNDLRPGQWSGGAGVGFLGSTPDGAAEFAFKGHADYFLTQSFSVGPVAQYAGAGNDVLFGLSAQAKFWWDIPGSRNLAKLVVQGGIGFVRAGIKASELGGAADTYASFLLPVGVGVDYTVTKQLAVTADFLLNFTSLGETVRAGGREFDFHTNVMPGLYLGVRF